MAQIGDGQVEFYLCGHFSAFFGTLRASLRTLPAMFRIVLAALSATGLANVGTDAAKFFCPITTKAHELCSGIANGSAFHVKLDAAGHHLNVFFLCARRGAMIADGCATEARFDTGFV